jgi:hypothetical protein
MKGHCARGVPVRGFVLDFSYVTGLRASEPVGTTVGDVLGDERENRWLPPE